jgi:UDPglucose 6-dehydrogenase
VVTDLARRLDRRCLVVGKSTVPVGTAVRLARLLHDTAPCGTDAELAWNPEFLREGFAIEDTMRPDRLLFGVESECRSQLELAFAPLLADGVPLVVTDLATAELVKVSANSFLATKISFINAMAEVCEVAGADVQALATALSYDPRIGGRFLRPGLGFGGGCLPKDIRAYIHRPRSSASARRYRSCARWTRSTSGDGRRCVQAGFRRHPRRTRPRCRPAAAGGGRDRAGL